MPKNYTDKSRRNDRIAEAIIRVGGILVVVSVVWILVMISKVSLPLFFPASATVAATTTAPITGGSRLMAVGSDEEQRGAFVLDE